MSLRDTRGPHKWREQAAERLQEVARSQGETITVRDKPAVFYALDAHPRKFYRLFVHELERLSPDHDVLEPASAFAPVDDEESLQKEVNRALTELEA